MVTNFGFIGAAYSRRNWLGDHDWGSPASVTSCPDAVCFFKRKAVIRQLLAITGQSQGASLISCQQAGACSLTSSPFRIIWQPAMRLLVTFVIGHLPWAEHLIPNFRRYASFSGADFLEVKWFPEMEKEFHNNPNWSCVAFLRRFALQDYYTEVLMVDSDVLFLPSCPNLFDMGGDLICVPDAAWPEKDERYWSWIRRNYPKSAEATATGPYFNAGVLLYRLEAVRKMNLEGPYTDDYANDQDFLNMRTAEAQLKINWLGADFNQRDVSDRHSALVNNRILHFVGRSKQHVEDFTRFLDY